MSRFLAGISGLQSGEDVNCDVDAFIEAAEKKSGCPYQWGGKGEIVFDLSGSGVPVYDCSGLVTCSLYEAGGPDWRQSHNAALLQHDLPAVATPIPGDLCFYGVNGVAHHVMIFVDDIMGQVFGASGGDRTTTTLAIAQKQGACVRYRPTMRYRGDLCGFARLQFT